jgi:hypothetical protein
MVGPKPPARDDLDQPHLTDQLCAAAAKALSEAASSSL